MRRDANAFPAVYFFSAFLDLARRYLRIYCSSTSIVWLRLSLGYRWLWTH